MSEIIRPPVEHQPKLFRKFGMLSVFDQTDEREDVFLQWHWVDGRNVIDASRGWDLDLYKRKFAPNDPFNWFESVSIADEVELKVAKSSTSFLYMTEEELVKVGADTRPNVILQVDISSFFVCMSSPFDRVLTDISYFDSSLGWSYWGRV